MQNIMTEESILEILSKFEDDLKHSKFVDLYNYMEILRKAQEKPRAGSGAG